MTETKTQEALDAALSRRRFLVGTALYGGALVALQFPKAVRAATTQWAPQVLTAEEWRDVEAITFRILPSDAGAGAREAACINFIDKALANEEAAMLPIYRAGIPALNGAATSAHGKGFAALEGEQQDALLRDLQDGVAEGWSSADLPSPDFFEMVRVHTLLGFLADPSYGGNRDYAGWRWVGYPGPRHAVGGYSPAQMIGKAPIRPIWQKR
ncbi:MAG: gluconate 2-dehydrogenase subunit 3 family protein [Deltaproteobacteria bacterium]|nr:gluconate 2-dehydrogenase subunit 3 family protein [Deltaproteobacteria bacterium]